jgi:ABC-type polysaccharide/polyol phosphate export permease
VAHAVFPYRDLVWELVKRELRVRYRRSIIGFTWTMLQPLMMMLVLQVAFSSIFRFDVVNFPVYVLSGLLFWNFFSQSIVTSMNSLRANSRLIQKLPVPKSVFPLSVVLSGLINLVLAMVPLFVILVLTGHPLEPALLFLPVSILIAGLFTLGAGLLLAPLSAFFYDVVELVGVGLQLIMFLTPIMYPMAIVPERFRWIVRFNPVRSILEVFRDPIYHAKVPPLSHLTVALGLALLLLVLGIVAFRRTSRKINLYL